MYCVKVRGRLECVSLWYWNDYKMYMTWESKMTLSGMPLHLRHCNFYVRERNIGCIVECTFRVFWWYMNFSLSTNIIWWCVNFSKECCVSWMEMRINAFVNFGWNNDNFRHCFWSQGYLWYTDRYDSFKEFQTWSGGMFIWVGTFSSKPIASWGFAIFPSLFVVLKA